jgi:uncharacterized membrane protein SpoIIM required for sporulation
MSPLQFEEKYQAEWTELDALLSQLQGRSAIKAANKKKPGEKESGPSSKATKTVISGNRFTQLYRRACEHLALARARAYPSHIIERLDRLTADAHQAIYSQRDFGVKRLAHFLMYDFPASVRAHAKYVWLATVVLMLPTIVLGFMVYAQPELVLSVLEPEQAAQYEEMYSDGADSIGRKRDANTDMMMFGHYIQHNISIGFKCFASGLFAGIGSLFFLAYNGVAFGAVAGYLTERGLAETFYSFVVTHAAFELTAIVLSGAAGIRIGHSLLAPGRRTRVQSLVHAARESIVVVFGAAIMLLIAAAIEAFWSSARWIPLPLKYSVAGVCWVAVISYFSLSGRRAS